MNSAAGLPDALLDAYLASTYRVRLPQGGWAEIRIGAPLPEPLRALLQSPEEPWGFITAWNPGSRPTPRTANRAAQHALLGDLRKTARVVRAGVGVGTDGWREPSLWAAGAAYDTLQRLARRYGQLAFVYGGGVATLGRAQD